MQVQFQGSGMPLSYGALFIKPVFAQITHDHDFFTKMSPFIVFVNGSQRVKTSVCQGGGKNPKWPDQIEINASSQDRIMIELFDHHTFSSNEVIAIGEIHVSKIVASGGNYQDYIPLFYKGQQAGTLMVQCQFIQSQSNMGMNVGGTQIGMNVGGMQPTYVQTGMPTTVIKETFTQPTTVYGSGGYQQQSGYQQQQGGYQQQQGGYQQQQGGFQQSGGYPQQTQTTFVQGSGYPQQTVIQGGGFPHTTYVQQPTVTETIQFGGGFGGGFPQQTTIIETQQPNGVVEEVIIEQPKHHHHNHHHHGGGGGGGFNVQYY
jgi:hypothetical protein